MFGPNGAGKSTLLRILGLLSAPSSGTVYFEGQELTEALGAYRRRIGMLSHRSYLYNNLSAEENLRFYGRMYSMNQLAARIDEVLDRVGLELYRNDLVRTFSRGMHQRLAIARAILHHPDILLLDEPYTGLDQHAAHVLESTLHDFRKRGTSCVMVSHDFERGLSLADQYVILHRGKVLERGQAHAVTPELLKKRFSELGGGGQ